MFHISCLHTGEILVLLLFSFILILCVVKIFCAISHCIVCSSVFLKVGTLPSLESERCFFCDLKFGYKHCLGDAKKSCFTGPTDPFFPIWQVFFFFFNLPKFGKIDRFLTFYRQTEPMLTRRHKSKPTLRFSNMLV